MYNQIKTHVIAAGAWQHLLVKTVSKLAKVPEISTIGNNFSEPVLYIYMCDLKGNIKFIHIR